MQQPPMTKTDKAVSRQERRDAKAAKRQARQQIRRRGHVGEHLAAKLGRTP